MCYFVSVSSFTACIIFTFRVRVRVSDRVRVMVRVFRVMVRVSASVTLRCRLVNKVSVRCVYRSGEITIIYRTVRQITSGLLGLGLGLGLGLVFLALALFKAKVKVTNILPNTVYLGIITLTVHWYTSVIGTAIVRRKTAY